MLFFGDHWFFHWCWLVDTQQTVNQHQWKNIKKSMVAKTHLSQTIVTMWSYWILCFWQAAYWRHSLKYVIHKKQRLMTTDVIFSDWEWDWYDFLSYVGEKVKQHTVYILSPCLFCAQWSLFCGTVVDHFEWPLMVIPAVAYFWSLNVSITVASFVLIYW